MENNFIEEFNRCLSEAVGDDYINSSNISDIDSIRFVELLILLQSQFQIRFAPGDFASLRSFEEIQSKVLELIKEK